VRFGWRNFKASRRFLSTSALCPAGIRSEDCARWRHPMTLFTTSISQQHLEFTQRYLSFFFIAMISPSYFDLNHKDIHDIYTSQQGAPATSGNIVFLYESSVFSCSKHALNTHSYI
jgi:hypothetical protein